MCLERETLVVVEPNVSILRWQAKRLVYAVGGETNCVCGGRRNVFFWQVSFYVAWRNSRFGNDMDNSDSALRESHSNQ
jgi:hypothetical protein